MISEVIARYPWLWTLVWQSTICLAAGLAGSYLLRRRAVRTHQVLLLSLIAATVLPVMTQIVKENQWGLFAAERAVPEPQRPALPPQMDTTTPPPPMVTGPRTLPVVPQIVETALVPPGIETLSAPVVAERFDWTRALEPVWLAAGTILLLRLTTQFLLGRRVVKRSQAIAEPRITGMVEAAKSKLGIGTAVAVRAGRHIRSPVIWCWARKPILLIPADSLRDSELDWMSILCHELAHWRRNDHLSGLFAELVICALPWQPLAWWARHRLAALSEEACDDWVLASGQTPTTYAKTLLGLAPQNHPAVVPGVVSTRKGLAARIHRILKSQCANPRSGLRWTLAAALLTACLGLGIAFAQTSIREPQATDKISAGEDRHTCSGRVLDAQGESVAGAKVAFYPILMSDTFAVPKVSPLETRTTGPDGTFAFSVTPQEMTSFDGGFIIVQRPPLAMGWAAWAGGENKQCEVILGDGRELAGIVVDMDGRPIADARVDIHVMDKTERVSDPNLYWPPLRLAGEETDAASKGDPNSLRWPATDFLGVKTDAAGRFSFPHMPAEATCEFIIGKSGYATAHTGSHTEASSPTKWWRYQFYPGQDDITLILLPENKVNGLVVEKSNGKPIGGVRVMAVSKVPQYESAISTDDGTFSIGGLSAGSYTIQLLPTPEGMIEWILEDEVRVDFMTDEPVENIRLKLVKGGILQVYVKDRDTAGSLADVDVTLFGANLPSGTMNEMTDKTGLAQFSLPTGPYAIDLYKTGYASSRQKPATVKTGESVRLDCTLGKWRKLTGIVRGPDGNPLPNVRLILQHAYSDASYSYTHATSDADGRFTIDWNPGGSEEGVADPNEAVTHSLFAEDPKRNLVADVRIDKKASDLDIRLELGMTITGKVVNHEGRPLPAVKVQASAVDGTLAWSEWRPILGEEGPFILGGPTTWGHGVTQEDGSFLIDRIPGRSPHTFSVRATARGYGSGRVEVSNAGNAPIDAGVMKLPPANLSISGVVVDANDVPVSGAEISCHGSLQPRVDEVLSDSQGRFTINGVCAGELVLSASVHEPRHMYAETDTEGGATDVKIVLLDPRAGHGNSDPKSPTGDSDLN